MSRVTCNKIDRFDLCLFSFGVLGKNKITLETAENAQKFKIAGHLSNTMTSSFMTMTHNWTVSSYYWIHLPFFEIYLVNRSK